MKKIDTLIEDIYSLLENGTNVSSVQNRDILHNFGSEMSSILRKALSEPSTEKRKPRLRMSQVGKPNRQLWYDMQEDVEAEMINGQTRIKFLYGDILEALLIALTELAGHTVTEKQEEVEVEGIKGHKDCRIDGVLVDIKSASPYAFKKFKEGTLHSDDPFGYIAQISGYAEAGNDNKAAFFAIDKSSADLALMEVQPVHMINASERIRNVKSMVSSSTPPERCYQPEPDGTSGNMKLAIGCVFCPYKFKCWDDANGGTGIRSFQYSNGVRHLVQVAKTPNVEEITDAA
jgi:hypothetical protein